MFKIRHFSPTLSSKVYLQQAPQNGGHTKTQAHVGAEEYTRSRHKRATCLERRKMLL
jgi:hypothetical protein